MSGNKKWCVDYDADDEFSQTSDYFSMLSSTSESLTNFTIPQNDVKVVSVGTCIVLLGVSCNVDRLLSNETVGSRHQGDQILTFTTVSKTRDCIFDGGNNGIFASPWVRYFGNENQKYISVIFEDPNKRVQHETKEVVVFKVPNESGGQFHFFLDKGPGNYVIRTGSVDSEIGDRVRKLVVLTPNASPTHLAMGNDFELIFPTVNFKALLTVTSLKEQEFNVDNLEDECGVAAPSLHVDRHILFEDDVKIRVRLNQQLKSDNQNQNTSPKIVVYHDGTIVPYQVINNGSLIEFSVRHFSIIRVMWNVISDRWLHAYCSHYALLVTMGEVVDGKFGIDVCCYDAEVEEPGLVFEHIAGMSSMWKRLHICKGSVEFRITGSRIVADNTCGEAWLHKTVHLEPIKNYRYIEAQFALRFIDESSILGPFAKLHVCSGNRIIFDVVLSNCHAVDKWSLLNLATTGIVNCQDEIKRTQARPFQEITKAIAKRLRQRYDVNVPDWSFDSHPDLAWSLASALSESQVFWKDVARALNVRVEEMEDQVDGESTKGRYYQVLRRFEESWPHKATWKWIRAKLLGEGLLRVVNRVEHDLLGRNESKKMNNTI